MKQAVEFAKDIVLLEKRILEIHNKYQNMPDRIYNAEMGDRKITLTQDIEELQYYCKNKNLNFNEVMLKAREELDDTRDINRKIEEAGE